MGVELVKDQRTKEPAPFEAVCAAYRACELGLLITVMGTHNNVLELMPALNVTEDEAEKGVDILERSIDDVAKGRVDGESVRRFVEG